MQQFGFSIVLILTIDFLIGLQRPCSLGAVTHTEDFSHQSSFLVYHSFSPHLLFPAEKWYKRHLTYQIVNWPRLLPLAAVRLAVGAAFQLWSNVSGLVFQEASDAPADIRLAFYEGDHNDGISNAFDGPGQPITAKLACR